LKKSLISSTDAKLLKKDNRSIFQNNSNVHICTYAYSSAKESNWYMYLYYR